MIGGDTETSRAPARAPLAAPHSSRVERVFQAASGLVIASFAAVHLANTAVAVRPGAYDAMQAVVRKGYQFPAFELALFGAILLHATLGVRAMWRRRGSSTSRLPLRTRLHRYAGWYLLGVMAMHVGAVRGLGRLEGTPPRFAGLSFSIAWLPWLFAPYYLLLGLSGLVHGVFGSALALATLGRTGFARLVRRTSFACVVAVAAAAVVPGLAGIAGVLYDIGDPFDNPYAATYRRHLGSFVPGPTRPK